MPENAGRRATDMEDDLVRDMLLKSGFDVTLKDDVAAFARFMRAMFALHEARMQASLSKRTWLIAVTSGALVALIPVLLKLLKVL